MKKILAPHKEQDGTVYLRVMRIPKPNAVATMPRVYPEEEYVPGPDYFIPTRSGRGIVVSYGDSMKVSRTISSRRVEEAVEMADYLKLCADEGLRVTFFGDLVVPQWMVSGRGDYRMAATLREAYWRYKSRGQI